MMRIKAKNKASLRIRVISAVALLAVLIALSVILSFAWFQNNIDVQGTGVTTGKMRYEFKGYHYNAAGTLLCDFSYSTADAENGLLPEETVVLDSINPTSQLSHFAPISKDQAGQAFFSVSRLEDSIDFTVSLTFDLEGLAVTDAQGNVMLGEDGVALSYINSMWFKFYDESGALIAYMGTAGNTVDGYIESTNTAPETAAKLLRTEESKNLSELLGARVSNDLNGDRDQFFVRMVYGWNADVLATQHTDVNIPIRVNLNVAQLGADEDETTGQIPVYTAEELRAALDNYLPGQTLMIMNDMTYVGDITLARPVSLTMPGTTFTVQGNLSYVYMDKTTFRINTAGGGQLVIRKNTNGIGGSLIADLPLAALELNGTNSADAGAADIYVEGDFRVRASLESGLKLNASRVCELAPSQDLGESVQLKDVTITGASRIQVATRTYAGRIVASQDCGRIIIVNSGFISQLNLQSMYRDSALTTVPVIDVDSYGYWTDPTILLPTWSVKFLYPDEQPQGMPQVHTGNTTIRSNMGSGIMKAYAKDHESFIDGQPDAAFFSDRDLPGIRDDIRYEYRDAFVEVLNDDKNEILVHYELPAVEKLEQYTQHYPNFGRSLRDTISYYIDKGDVAAQTALIQVKVICYGENELTADDYAFLRGMSALEVLDISECVSTDMTLPEGALQGLSNLSTVTLPQYDTVWKPNILAQTAVQELTLPANLQKLENSTTYDTASQKYVENYDVIHNIRFIHTSYTIPAGSLNTYGIHNRTNNLLFNVTPQRAIRQYFFVPDATTLDLYRTMFDDGKNNWMVWRRCVFLEAQRYGDYFLRLNESQMTCEFVTNVKNAAFDPAVEAFDFTSITVDNKVYTITSYDDYAFCYRFADKPLELELPATVTSVGAYAFAGAAYYSNGNSYAGSITELTLLGNTSLGDYAFAYNSAMTEVVGTQVTSAGGYAFYRCSAMTRAQLNSLSHVTGGGLFAECTALKRLDIGLIEKTADNTASFTANVPSAIIVEIHTSGYALPAYSKALTSPLGRTFVQDFYANLYADDFGHLAELGTHTMESVLRADEDGNILPVTTPQEEVAYYFFLRENAQGEMTDAVLSACMLSKITGSGTGKTDVLMPVFTDLQAGVSYPVVRIGRAAFRTTQISNVDVLKVPDTVTTIGHGALAADSFAKYCVTLDLNNTVIADADAFYKVSCVRLYGNKLEQTGVRSISGMTKLVLACLPELNTFTDGFDPASTTVEQSVFGGCSALRLAYVGPSTGIKYMRNGNNNNYFTSPSSAPIFFFIDGEGVDAYTTATYYSHMKVFIANTPTSMYYGDNKIDAGEDFGNLVLSNWYSISGSVGTSTLGLVSYTVTIPGYVYSKAATAGQLNLEMASEDIAMLPGVAENYASVYLTPEVLYQEGNITYYDADHTDGVPAPLMPRYTAREDVGGVFAYKVIYIKSWAYRYVAITAPKLQIGKYTENIDANVFTYNASISSTTVDLSNVKSVGSSSMTTATSCTTLIANKLETAYSQAFTGMKIKSLYLPAIKTLDSYPFLTCTALEEVVLGENLSKVSSNPFGRCTSLKKIVFLSKTKTLPQPNIYSESYWGDKSVEANLVFVVAAGLLQDTDSVAGYDTYGTNKDKFCNTPISNFETYEGAHPEGVVTYFWENVGNGKVAITSFAGQVDTLFTLPSAVVSDQGQQLTVVSVSGGVFNTLPATVKVIMLPNGMEYINFLSSNLPSSLEMLVIADTNTKFQTVGGVLYSKDGSTLYAFPRALRTDELAFTLPATVTTIECEAFYGAAYLTKVTFEGSVVIRDRAFANANNLEKVVFLSQTPSVFAGRDTFLGRNTALAVEVPEGRLAAYQSNIWHDFSILALLREMHEHALNEFGYCTLEGCEEPDAVIEKWNGAGEMTLAQGAESRYIALTLEAGKTYELHYAFDMGNTLFEAFQYSSTVFVTVDPGSEVPDKISDASYTGAGFTATLSQQYLTVATTQQVTLYLCVTANSAFNVQFSVVLAS